MNVELIQEWLKHEGFVVVGVLYEAFVVLFVLLLLLWVFCMRRLLFCLYYYLLFCLYYYLLLLFESFAVCDVALLLLQGVFLYGSV